VILPNEPWWQTYQRLLAEIQQEKAYRAAWDENIQMARAITGELRQREM
jgi:hypothetical protein